MIDSDSQEKANDLIAELTRDKAALAAENERLAGFLKAAGFHSMIPVGQIAYVRVENGIVTETWGDFTALTGGGWEKALPPEAGFDAELLRKIGAVVKPEARPLPIVYEPGWSFWVPGGTFADP